jgi:hypothetical protein
MTNLVTRLRVAANEPIGDPRGPNDRLMDEAADEIERVRAALCELVRLKDLRDACEDQTYWATRAVSRETLDQLHAWEENYKINKPKAWETARAILGNLT